MQSAVVSQSNREDEKPRFILLAFDLETDDRRIELDSRHLRADYRLPGWRLQVEQNLDPTGQSKRRESSKLGI
jgi:hypothetical protein